MKTLHDKSKAKTLGLFDLMKLYPTKQSAYEYLEKMRWGENLHCVRCGSTEKIIKNKKKHNSYWCGFCRKYFNAQTGTPLEAANLDRCNPVENCLESLCHYVLQSKFKYNK